MNNDATIKAEAQHEMRVCVLCGGDSGEREVSLHSAERVYQTLCSNPVMPHEGSRINTEMFCWDGDASSLIEHITNNRYTCVFNALHGGSGENGLVQALLNMIKMPYTGSGMLASSIGMNKKVQYDLLTKYDIRIPKYDVCDIHKIPSDWPMPFVIKPVDGGSSLGVELVRTKDELSSICKKYQDDCDVLISEYIPGVELTASVLDTPQHECRFLGVTEIAFASDIFSYDLKYEPTSVTHNLPAHIPAHVQEDVRRMSLCAHKALGCRGLTRCDYRYDGTRAYFLEINTLPGLTSCSLSPEQAEFAGISYHELACQLILSAQTD